MFQSQAVTSTRTVQINSSICHHLILSQRLGVFAKDAVVVEQFLGIDNEELVLYFINSSVLDMEM